MKKTSVSLPLVMAALSACQTKVEQPNVLFILVDDMQRDAIAACGNRDTYTPNIDQLLTEGVSFGNTYTNGALCGALSMPSRAMLMTGRGVFDIQSDGMKIPEAHTTFPEQFRKHGYRTFATGKWHSDKESFARSFSEGEHVFLGGMHPYELNGHKSPHLNHYENGAFEEFVGEDFSSLMFADAAVDFLESTKDNDQPFLAYVAFTSPHDPRNQLPDYGQKYKGDTLTVPTNFLSQHPFDNGELTVRDELVLPAPRSEAQIKDEMAFYYGMVSEVDLQIGRVLEALEKTGKKDNTIIVFASDNGLALGQNGLLGKQSLYEHSVKVPMCIVDPRNEKNQRQSDALCYLYDIYPTLCEMAGIEIPASVTGRSLNSVVKGSAEEHREDLFLIYSNLHRGLVKDGYKYIIYNVNGTITEQLFNLNDDEGEINNLAAQMPDKATDYKALLGQRMKENNDFCNLDNKLWWNDGHKIKWNELIKLYIFE